VHCGSAAMTERHEFQAEVKQLLGLMVHSLYSNKDIFLRELISNASDALDRLRFEQLTNDALRTDAELGIWIEPDVGARTLSIVDNGIGMTAEEVVKNLGTIARSGTKEFLETMKQASRAEAPMDLIGQFGVGFYSSFMVADEVTVVTKRAGSDEAVQWKSTGDGYTLETAARHQHGTTVTLHLKPKDEENSLHDYTDRFVLGDIVKRYSDFVAYPIKMKVWTEKEASGAKVLEEQKLNSGKAIWARGKDEVKPEELDEFYRHIAHDWHPPLLHIPVKMEGTFEAQAILFIPKKAPFDLYHPEMKRGIQLYVKRVFIMDECKELMPPYLRFVKGVVDAQDLSLNVSREILQKDRHIRIIRKQLTKKIHDTLETLARDDRAKFIELWKEFGPVLKEGLVGAEDKEKDRILDVLLACSSKGTDLTTIDEYVGRMKGDQKAIYYLTGPSPAVLASSPHLEALTAKGYEVLFFTDPIDEIWLDRHPTRKELPFESVAKGAVGVESDDDKKRTEEKEKEHKGLLQAIRARLQDDVKEVRLSSRLSTSVSCLVGDPDDVTPQMEKILRQLNQEIPKVKRILELNPSHPLLAKLQKVYAEDPKSPVLEDAADLLYGQALLAEGGQPADPARFARLVADWMVRAI
jgi:molecular chaperone HtpG